MDVGFVSNVTNAAATASNYSNDKAVKAEEKSEKKSGFSEDAAVYEKSKDDKAVKKTSVKKMSSEDRASLVASLKADQEKMQANLLSIVQKSITGQGKSWLMANFGSENVDSENMWKVLANGDFEADADTIAKAKEDIADDGYWGVDKTSSRIVDFAIALSGDDPKKADLMINAFKKGYEQATGAWGKDLPDISSKTYDAVMEKFDKWKNGELSLENQAMASPRQRNNTTAAESES